MVELLPCHTVTVELRGVAVPPSEVPSCGLTHLIGAATSMDATQATEKKLSAGLQSEAKYEADDKQHGLEGGQERDAARDVAKQRSLRPSEVTRRRTVWVSMRM